MFSAASLHTGPVHGQPCGHPRSRPAQKASADEKGTPKKDNDRKKENLFPTHRLSFSLPNPKSQSLFQRYRSILPTSLTHIISSTRGSSPWRPAAVIGTVRRESGRAWPVSEKDRLSIALCVASIFKGRRKRTGRLKVRGALPAVQPRLRPTRFRGRPKATLRRLFGCV